MKTVSQLLSLKKVNSGTIDKLIIEKTESIKSNLDQIFTDVNTANEVGIELQELANLKDAKLLMSGNEYKAYEAGGKITDFDSFRANLEY